MSDLIVIGYPDEETAEKVWDELVKLQEDFLVDLEDAAIIRRDQKGRLHVTTPAHHAVTWGTLSGLFWGVLIGLIFPVAARPGGRRGPAANVIGKGLTGRRRPYADVPVRSRLRRVPRSSSFPSGHAANAAAFAIGAAIEMPSLAAPGIALASAVGASRVATGVHYPSDVLAGTAIGGAAGLATLRWWPRRPRGRP